MTLHHGDCLEVMATMPDESVDAVVTDPPYNLGFMGKAWDERHQHEPWAREAFRVAKPGAHLLAFGGTRTYHRLAAAIEDAGWEIRDCLVWAYASGFPKSLAPYRSILSGICQYHERAPHAVTVSPWHLLGSLGEKAPAALALAETLPGGELLVLIRTGAEDGTSGVTATPLSDFLTDDTTSSIEWSWNGYSADRWLTTSTSIIETVARAITDLITSNSWESWLTASGTPEDVSRPDGCVCDVLVVASSSTDVNPSSPAILWPSAHEPVTSPLAPLRGLGTAAKPAWEPIVMARKPLRGTVAANVTAHGTGALNIDGTRIEYAGPDDLAAAITTQGNNADDGRAIYGGGRGMRPPEIGMREFRPVAGRWPANVVLTDPIFDGGVDGVVGGGEAGGGYGSRGNGDRTSFALDGHGESVGYGDSGTYSRFFLIPKAARSDREPVLGGLPERKGGSMSGPETRPDRPTNHPLRANIHPTVKPTDLMRHLVRLVTPPGGCVLDPFLGSGSTALACEMEGFAWIGIEKEAEYVAITEARLNGTQRGLGLNTRLDSPRRPSKGHWPKSRPAGKGGWGHTGQSTLAERIEE